MQTTMCENPAIAGKYMRPVGVWRSAGVDAASLICAMEGSPPHADASVGDHIVWGGHATVRIVLGGEAVLTDPVLRRRVMHLQRVVPLVAGLGTDLRAVLISHLHHDHLDLASLRMLPGAAQIVVPVGARPALGRRTLQRVIELAPGESVDIGGVQVRATIAAHDGGRAGRRGVAAPALGYVIERAATTVYFAGDTDIFAGMADIAPRIDCALLPVWGWGSTIGPGHLDPERAADALTLLRPRIAVPIHWGTYRPVVGRGAPPPQAGAPETRFAAAAALRAPGVAVRILAPGEPLAVGGAACAGSAPLR
jgi:L-ascorbate metabolism protein UlaG (beta-lactamase superfamily)